MRLGRAMERAVNSLGRDRAFPNASSLRSDNGRKLTARITGDYCIRIHHWMHDGVKMQRHTRTLQWTLILGAMGLAARAQESTSVPETLTVDQAVSYALQQNPSLRTAELEVEKSGDNLAAFRTRRLPSISWNMLGGQLLTKPTVTFDRGVFGTYPGVGPIPGEETKVHNPRKPTAFVFGQILQPLSQQYRLGLGVKLLDLERQIETAKLAERRAAVAEQVRKAYYRLLETQSALESVEESLPLYRETVRLAQVGLRLETVLAEPAAESRSRSRQGGTRRAQAAQSDRYANGSAQ